MLTHYFVLSPGSRAFLVSRGLRCRNIEMERGAPKPRLAVTEFESICPIREEILPAYWHGSGAFDRCVSIRYDTSAGWSSLVARRAHNPEVVGSNPTPATSHHIQFTRACSI